MTVTDNDNDYYYNYNRRSLFCPEHWGVVCQRERFYRQIGRQLTQKTILTRDITEKKRKQ